MLNAKIKSLKQQGKESVQHKEAIPVDDLKKLKAGPVFQSCKSLLFDEKRVVSYNFVCCSLLV